MADFIDHVDQAIHNLQCAKLFFANRSCGDWAITAAFYSALHFVEAGFTSTPIIHSEQSKSQDQSSHNFRENEIHKLYDEKCWRSYRKLFEACYNVRYLALWRKGKQGVALHYYQSDDITRFIDIDVENVREGVQIKSGLNLSG